MFILRWILPLSVLFYLSACTIIPDIDNDGISDKEDRCPHNSTREIMHGVYQSGLQIGCPLDSDTDGVQDIRDKCPNTPADMGRVDNAGCSPSEANKRSRPQTPSTEVFRGPSDYSQYSPFPTYTEAVPIFPSVSAPDRLSPQNDRENYAHFDDNPLKAAQKTPTSTFSIDVDTGSYSNVRRMINTGYLLRKDAVRVEELINYFDYDYPPPRTQNPPFSVFTQIAPTPWNAKTHLLHIGIQTYQLNPAHLPPANLVFLLDVSGSMNAPNKLPLLKASLKLLTRQLTAQDRVSIVVYAGAAGEILAPTPGHQTAVIEAALARLSAGGSTNGGQGIQLAYSIAQKSFIPGGINRVLLATDGDFNVGTIDFEALKDLVEQQSRTGIALTTLGFGAGHYNDHLMEQLAQAGNGNYAYIDTLNEARKVLVEARAAMLLTVAKDVKIQVEFNPDNVAEYRLMGYENRGLKSEDFDNDNVDAGEIGAGHTVTALYELALVGSGGERLSALRYQIQKPKLRPHTHELAFLRLRYKQPDSEKSQLLQYPILRSALRTANRMDERFRFAAAVAAFGQLLRGGKYLQDFDFDAILKLARSARGEDKFGYRNEFIRLISLAKGLY